jgi:hypothetical protein
LNFYKKGIKEVTFLHEEKNCAAAESLIFTVLNK